MRELLPAATPVIQDDTVIRFVRPADRASDEAYTGVLVDGVPLPQRIVYHSPTGFEFGYGGSGPADLALNILVLFISHREAEQLHQDFKWAFIAAAFPGMTLRASTIRGWIHTQSRAVRQDA